MGMHSGKLILRTPDGRSVSLQELTKSGPVLLAFYKASCPTCQLTMPYLQRLAPKATVYAVSQNPAEDAMAFDRRFRVNLPILLDRAEDGYPVSNAFGITHVPSLFLLDKGGTEATWSSVGFVKRELESLAERLDSPLFRPEDVVPEAKSG